MSRGSSGGSSGGGGGGGGGGVLGTAAAGGGGGNGGQNGGQNVMQGDGLSRVGVGSYHPPRQYENTERIGEGSRKAMAGEYERNMQNNPTAVAFAVSWNAKTGTVTTVTCGTLCRSSDTGRRGISEDGKVRDVRLHVRLHVRFIVPTIMPTYQRFYTSIQYYHRQVLLSKYDDHIRIIIDHIPMRSCTRVY